MILQTREGLRYYDLVDNQAINERELTSDELAKYKLEQYVLFRTQEYPSIGDQLDALFHAGVFPAEMAAQIQAVKDKYPKGGN